MPTEITYHVAAADSWAAAEAVATDDRRITAAGQLIQAVSGGVTGGAAPDFTGQEGATLSDGTVQWKFCCVRDYARLSDLFVDIGVGISNTLVTDDEKWEILLWHDRRGAFDLAGYQQTTMSFAETCTPTNNVVIRPAPGESIWENIARGVDPVRYDETKGFAVHITYSGGMNFVAAGSGADYCEAHDLQIKISGANANGLKVDGRTGFLFSGCLIYSTGANAAANIYSKNGGLIQNCVAISDSSVAGKSLIRAGWNGNVANCLSVYLGTAPSGASGFYSESNAARFFNNVAVNFDTDFAGTPPANGNFFYGNISSDGSATSQLAGTGVVSNAINLVTDYASMATLDCQPPDGSPVFTDSTAESDFTYTPENDVFGEPRGLNDGTAYRGPICSLPASVAVELVADALVSNATVQAGDLIASSVLTAQDLLSNSSVSSDDLIQSSLLVGAALMSAATLEAGALTGSSELVAVPVISDSFVEGVSLVSAGALLANDLYAATTVQAGGLSAAVNLSPGTLHSSSTVSHGTLTATAVLEAANLMSQTAINNAQLTTGNSLVVQGLQSETITEIADLVLHSVLQAAALVSDTLLDHVDLGSGSTTLTVQDLMSSTHVDQAVLALQTTLEAQEIYVTNEVAQALLTIGILARPVNPRLRWAEETRHVRMESDSKHIHLEDA